MRPLRRGLVRIIVFSVVFCVLGLFLSYLGLSALADGQAMIHPKRGPAYIATPNGPHAILYLLHTWGFATLGGVTLAVGLAPIYVLLAGANGRREALLADAGGHLSGSVVVPAWLLVSVLVAFLALIGYGFYRAT